MIWFVILSILSSLSGCDISLRITNTIPNSIFTIKEFNKSDTALLKAIWINLNEKSDIDIYKEYLKGYNSITKLKDRSIDGYFNYMYLYPSSPFYYKSGGGFWQDFRDKVKMTLGGKNEK